MIRQPVSPMAVADALSSDAFRAIHEAAIAALMFLAASNNPVSFDARRLFNDAKDSAQRAPRSQDELTVFSAGVPELRHKHERMRIEEDERRRRRTPQPLDREFSCIRFGTIFNIHARPRLSNLLHMWAAVIGYSLQIREWKCPRYSEIFVELDQTLEKAFKFTHPEPWATVAYGAIDLDRFETAAPEVQAEMAFEAMSGALRRLAEIDHLNLPALLEALEEAKALGPEAELPLRSAESNRYHVVLKYKVVGPMEATPMILEVTDRQTQKKERKKVLSLPRAPLYLPYLVSNLSIKGKLVTISPRTSEEAQRWLALLKKEGISSPITVKIE
jgi:hypothetical protein